MSEVLQFIIAYPLEALCLNYSENYCVRAMAGWSTNVYLATNAAVRQTRVVNIIHAIANDYLCLTLTSGLAVQAAAVLSIAFIVTVTGPSSAQKVIDVF
jgi:hypothetical protein